MILKAVWWRGRVANQWRFAHAVWIPRKVISKRFNSSEKILLQLPVPNTSAPFYGQSYRGILLQKGWIVCIPCSLGHIGVVMHLLKEAKENKDDLVVLVLDFANGYGSVPYKLVEQSLRRYHVPIYVKNLIQDYYNDFSIKTISD